MLHRVRFLRDEPLSCGHLARRFTHARVIHSKHRAKSVLTPIRCPECGDTVMVRSLRRH